MPPEKSRKTTDEVDSTDKSLFDAEYQASRVAAVLLANRERLSIAYMGDSVANGRMDAALVGEGLRGAARFVNRVGELYLGPEIIHLEIDGEPQSGSLEIFVNIAHSALDVIRNVGDNKLLVGLSVIVTLTGFSLRDVGKSFLWVFKKLKGRPIDSKTNLKDVLPQDAPIELALFIRIYNDPEVQAAIRAALRPLRAEGIEFYETRSNRRPIERISKSDLLAADAAEMDAIVSDEDKFLDIEKVSFVPHLAWHLSDEGKPFDAKIADENMWKQISAGDQFGYGDRLHVSLHTEAAREANGKLKIVRTVTKVYRIVKSDGTQIPMFEDPKTVRDTSRVQSVGAPKSVGRKFRDDQ